MAARTARPRLASLNGMATIGSQALRTVALLTVLYCTPVTVPRFPRESETGAPLHVKNGEPECCRQKLGETMELIRWGFLPLPVGALDFPQTNVYALRHVNLV